MRHRVTYTLTLRPNTPGVKAGSLVRVWLPFPQEYRQQRDVKLISASPEPKLIAPNAVEGNPVGGAPQRTVYFEQQVTDPSQADRVQGGLRVHLLRLLPQAGRGEGAAAAGGLERRLPGRAPAAHRLHARAPPAGRQDRRQRDQPARQGPQDLPLGQRQHQVERRRRVLHHPVLRHQGLHRRARRLRRAEAPCSSRSAASPASRPAGRAAGRPSRPRAGACTIGPRSTSPPGAGCRPTPPTACRSPTTPGSPTSTAATRTATGLIVNLDWGRELFPPKQSLRSEPADFQRGEVEVDGQNLYFDQWDYTMKVECDPGPSPE